MIGQIAYWLSALGMAALTLWIGIGDPVHSTRKHLRRHPRLAAVVAMLGALAAIAAGLTVCALIALSPIGTMLGWIAMATGVAAFLWEIGSLIRRGIMGRRRR